MTSLPFLVTLNHVLNSFQYCFRVSDKGELLEMLKQVTNDNIIVP